MTTPADEPIRTITTAGHQSLITWAQQLLVPYYGSAEAAVPAAGNVGALTSRDRYGLAQPGDADLYDADLDDLIGDVLFRMLEPHEIAAAMAFDPSTKSSPGPSGTRCASPLRQRRHPTRRRDHHLRPRRDHHRRTDRVRAGRLTAVAALRPGTGPGRAEPAGPTNTATFPKGPAPAMTAHHEVATTYGSRIATRWLAGTVTGTDTGQARVGLLEGGRGLAATRTRVDGPGRRHTSAEETVETWVVGGRKATNRAGAAEYLGLAANTVTVYSSPAGRRTHGWPHALDERVNGQEVFALADLDAFAASRAGEQPARPIEGDPDELLSVDEFATLRQIKRDTMKRYVEDSLNAWHRGEDGYLPQPDQTEPARHGTTYCWRRDKATAWIFPTTRRTGGRKPGRRPQLADLRQVLTAAGPGPRPIVREIAAALTELLGTEVSSQTVRRLLRRHHDDNEATRQ